MDQVLEYAKAHASCELRADYDRDRRIGTWQLLMPRQEPVSLVEVEGEGLSRILLARTCFVYETGLYGGYALHFLHQGETTVRVMAYTSNNHQSGFWARVVYGTPTKAQLADDERPSGC